MRRLATLLPAALAAAALVGSTADGAVTHDRGSYWTIGQAASITSIRSMRVRVRQCSGLGRSQSKGGVRRYRHFRCLAGTRAPWETYDTIAVLYVLHTLQPYAGPGSRHTLTQVRFIGGPAIP
jgi:hypothetical protein